MLSDKSAITQVSSNCPIMCTAVKHFDTAVLFSSANTITVFGISHKISIMQQRKAALCFSL